MTSAKYKINTENCQHLTTVHGAYCTLHKCNSHELDTLLVWAILKSFMLLGSVDVNVRYTLDLCMTSSHITSHSSAHPLYFTRCTVLCTVLCTVHSSTTQYLVFASPLPWRRSSPWSSPSSCGPSPSMSSCGQSIIKSS